MFLVLAEEGRTHFFRTQAKLPIYIVTRVNKDHLHSVIQFSLDRTGQYFFMYYDAHNTVQYRWQGNLAKRTGALRTPLTQFSSLKWPSMLQNTNVCFCKDIFCSFSLLMFFTALCLCCVVESNEVARFRFRLSLGEIELKSHLILGSGSRMRSSF